MSKSKNTDLKHPADITTVDNSESHTSEKCSDIQAVNEGDGSSALAENDGSRFSPVIKDESDHSAVDTALEDKSPTEEGTVKDVKTSVAGDHSVAAENVTVNASGTAISEKHKSESLHDDERQDKDDGLVQNVQDIVSNLKDLDVSASEASTGDDGQQAKEEEKKDSGPKIPREHDSLWSLLSQIPKKAQRGLLMQCDLILTCIHADENFIALGTNIGIVFLYHRKQQTLERLKSETSNDVVTCVQLHHGIDYQLAVGMASGAICIFQLPSMMTGLNKQLQKFYVKDMHRTILTCIEWSTNGMRLFSGDKMGTVVATEVDFYQGQCKSDVLLKEAPAAVVQLHYNHKALLISTKQRSLVCRLDEENKTFQVGQKDRKVEGGYGACFIPGLCKTSDAQLYAARPNLRLWRSNITGTVLNTNIFKDLIGASNTEIYLVRPEKHVKTTEPQFGKLHIYCGSLILTWTSTWIIILDPEANSVVGYLDKAGYISDVCVHHDEIFVLRRNTETDLIRLALKPEAIPKVHALLSDLQSSSITSTDSFLRSVTGHVTPNTRSSPDDQDKTNKHVSPKAFIKKNIFGKLNKLLDGVSDSVSSRTLGQFSEVSVKQLIDDGPSSDVEPADLGGSKSPVLPPVVKLRSPELPPLHVYVSDTGSPLSPSSSENMDSSSSTTMSPCVSALVDSVSVFDSDSRKDSANPSGKSLTESGETVTTVEHIGLISERVKVCDNQADASDDLVFSHKTKKHKKKKNKHAVISSSKKKEEDKIGDKSDSIHSRTTDTESLNTEYSTASPVKEVPSLDPTETLRIADEILKRTHELIQGASSQLEQSQSVDDFSAKPTDDSSSKPADATADPRSTSTVVRPSDIPYVYNVDESSLPQLDTSRSVINKLNKTAAVMSASYDPTKPDTDPDHMSPVKQSASKNSDGSVYSTPDTSTDDFYKKYIPPLSPTSTDSLISPVDQTVSPQPESEQGPHPPSNLDSEPGPYDGTSEVANGTLRRLANSWSEISAPANIYSLALSDTHIWFTDKSEHIYFSAINSPKGILWRKASGSASQISVSRSGKIVWRLHKGTAYAGTKITAKRPEGMKWVEAVRDVAFIAVDNRCAWYVKNNGTVMIQKGLSVERPCFRSTKVDCAYDLKQIVCRDGVVWAVTKDYMLIYRKGITAQCSEGTDWDVVDVCPEGLLCTNVALSDQDIGWALDVAGRVWFCSNVTRENPTGDGKWWQVPMSEYFVQDATAIDALRSLARKFDPQKLSYLLSTSRGGLIAAGAPGIWVCFEYKNILHVCRGNFLGYRWVEAQLMEMASSTVWKTISACNADLEWGQIWAQQPNGELFTFSASTSPGTWVTPSPLFMSLHAGPTSVWGLDDTGNILVRAGMGPYCPGGSNWSELDLSQLGDSQLIHVSCNALFVWAVDCEGHVYHRIGAKAPQDQQLSPAWLPIDSFSEIVFTKVIVGPLDWMVWAIDNRRLAYVRIGITDNMPIGSEWIHIPGTQIMELALSKTGVWALNPNGEVLFRYGISLDNVCGDYWKKLPGVFSHLSVSPSDDLWAISMEGQMQHCHMKYILRRQLSVDQTLHRTMSSGSEEGEWELV
ncbi:tectonin beta-propeller repeat-containing protein 2-like [Gigantopelta aegis]|uniref:tectonin beta-propeller repeat-containing protein 2-like n=1 Tax=Gigantopelta aegis TaxID=1735272 RepID=UPI001B88B672|nr:tectonin beta-propeller repeat-containing protein 2-like [Gigantopelta aegis]